MKILLDECLPKGLKKEISSHEVTTVAEEGWAGIKNGALLDKACKNFDLFITVDRNLSFQQNLEKLQIAVIVLKARTNRLADLIPLAPKIKKLLSTIKKGQVIKVS